MLRQSLTVLATLAFGLAWNQLAVGQDLLREVTFEPNGAGLTVLNRQELSADGQIITIISERVIEPRESREKASELEQADVSLTSTDAAETTEGNEGSPEKAVSMEVPKKDSSKNKPECDCLYPGGSIWEKLLAKEMDKARLLARVELEETKFQLYREHMTQRINELEKELEARNRERMARERETEAVLQRERRQFEQQREEQERHARGLQQRLEVVGRESAEANELRNLLKVAGERIEKLSDENAAIKAEMRQLEKTMEVTKRAFAEELEESRKRQLQEEQAREKEKEKGKPDRKKKD